MRWVVLALAVRIAAAQQIELPNTPGLTGKLLVATNKSHDPELGRTVILLIHDDANGAIGLVLNRPVAGSKPPMWSGGPIPLEVRTLVRSRVPPRDAEHIFGDVYLLRKEPASNQAARVYAGYAGWAPHQLNDEIVRGLWKILPGDAKAVFDPNPATLWSRLLR